MYSDINFGGATTTMRVGFEKDGGSLATSLLAQPRTSSDCNDIEQVIETKTWLAPGAQIQQETMSPVQQTSIRPTMVSEQTGTVLPSVRCHPSKRSVKTPRDDMVPSEAT